MPRKSIENSNASLLKFFSPVRKDTTKNDKPDCAILQVTSSAPFNTYFLPFNVTKTMTMAPVNRFQHPVAPNFAEMVFGNTRNNDSNSENLLCNPSIPQKTKESEKYIREFLSTVRPELLKKRGTKTLVSAKEIILQTNHEPLKMDIDDDNNNGCESMDWSIRSGTATKECSFVSVSEMPVDDLSSLFRDKKKIWMKLLQFEENYRPPYYGIDDDGWIVPTGYLSEDEMIEEADESASVTSSESSPFIKKRAGNYKEYNQAIIEPSRPLIIGPILEESPGDSNHQLAEYSIKFLNANIILPYNPFAVPITNKRKAKDSNIEDTYDKEQLPNKSRSKGKSNQKNKDQVKSNEVKPTANIVNDNVMVTFNCTS
ncbi:23921_t:CDS:2 [Cetraspora pellucida]|uniref:23921_t:CDS:1 n=1 Tax=Cetraspora pellucida TaxID=1433469 RepID=A0A9N9IA29_9GLOM|nr:23921_t:CDS:2 [Cetraspora pellucida]